MPVAAHGRGVIAEMVYHALMQKESADFENYLVNDYVNHGYGSDSNCWQEEITCKALDNVKNRKISSEEVAVLLEVFREEILVDVDI